MPDNRLTETFGRGFDVSPAAPDRSNRAKFGIAPTLARFASWHWVSMYCLVAGAWIFFFGQSIPVWAWSGAGVYGIEFWVSLCLVDPSAAGFFSLFAMWGTMSAAMMLPTFFPMLAVYEDLGYAGAGTGTGYFGLAFGYLSPWILYSAAAATIQIELASIQGSENAGPIVASMLLAGAGLYQFSPMKLAFLARCRSPFSFFAAHWSGDLFNEFRLGARLGLLCVGCCWFLMAMSLIGGIMNLLWMGLAMVVMTVEKLPHLGRFVTRPLGLVLIAAAGWQALVYIT